MKLTHEQFMRLSELSAELNRAGFTYIHDEVCSDNTWLDDIHYGLPDGASGGSCEDAFDYVMDGIGSPAKIIRDWC